MKIKKFAILTILTLLFFIGCGDKEKIDEDMVSGDSASQQAPEFNLKTHDGKDIKIVVGNDGWKFKGYEDKVILLNFFGTWCPPCKAEIPHLLNIKEKLKNDFEIIAVDIGKRDGTHNTQAEIDTFIKQFGVNYPIVIGEENRKLFSAVMELNQGGSIPFMILFNKKGQYVQYYIGMKPEEMLFSDISQAINLK
jgi:thiol-disulfide isomerase/thioredoxin